MTTVTKEAPKAAAAKGANTKQAEPQAQNNTRELGGTDLSKLISIERKARAFNSSVNRDVKLDKFCQGDFKLPRMFDGNNFEATVRSLGKENISEYDQKQETLASIIDSKIDDEVNQKMAEFEGWPLTESQRHALEAAQVEYREFLTQHIAQAKKMLQVLK